jgi:hypothetical protein
VRRGRVRWWAWRAGAAAGLGVVTTVGVAWTAAAYADIDLQCQTVVWVRDESAVWCTARATALGASMTQWNRGVEAGRPLFEARQGKDLEEFWIALPDHVKAGPDRPAPTQRLRLGTHPDFWDGVSLAVEHERGWPFRGLYCIYRVPNNIAPATWHGGIQFRDSTSNPTVGLTVIDVLPTRPIWSGLILNSALYAAGWGLLLIGPRRARARRRKQRGWCLSCGYDLVGSSSGVCPECGVAG